MASGAGLFREPRPEPEPTKGDRIVAKVKMTTCLASADHVWNIGDTYECDDAEAKRMIAAGFADPIVEKRVEKRPAKAAVESREASG